MKFSLSVNDLTQGPIFRHMLVLAIPMMVGIAANMSFNLVDTYFIGQLGPVQLTAISFSFPVVLTILNLSIGLAIGINAVLSRLLGQGQAGKVKSLSSGVLLVSFLFASLAVLIGNLTITELFSLIGASTKEIHLISPYMKYAYIAMGLRLISIAVSGIYRAHGITLVPSLGILITAGINLALDPLLIFGLWGLPQMGIEGAGMATMISNLAAVIFEVGLAHYKYGFFGKLRKIDMDGAGIARISAIAAASNALNPVSLNLYNFLLAKESSIKVAGLGIGTKIQFFSMVPVLALSAAIGPIIGQNLGGKNFARIDRTAKLILWTALIWGAIQFICLTGAAGPLSEVFTDKSEIIEYSKSYLGGVSFSFFGYSLVILCGSCLNALNAPGSAFFLTFLRTLGLFAAGLMVFSAFGAQNAILDSIAFANVLSGIASIWWLRRILNKMASS